MMVIICCSRTDNVSAASVVVVVVVELVAFLYPVREAECLGGRTHRMLTVLSDLWFGVVFRNWIKGRPESARGVNVTVFSLPNLAARKNISFLNCS